MIRKTCAVAIAIVVGSTAATAQQSRPELLRAAVLAADDFAAERALDLVKAAVSPALGPLDSTWVRSVHLLTQLLVEANNPDQARVWARWAMRTLPGMRIDSVNFVASVANALREAQTFASVRTAGDAVTTVSWRWAARGSREPNGRLLLGQSPMPVPVSVRVVGGSFITTSGLSLPPGSYEIEAGAPGYLPARLTREVLPGVTTVLTFNLTSAAVAADVVADNVKQRVFQNVVPLTVRRYTSAPSCAAAAYVSRDGLLITSYQAIRGADSIAVASGAAQAIRIAAHDVAGDLVVLHVGGTRADSVAVAGNIADGQSAWAVRLADCRTPSESRVRVTQWNARPAGRLQLGDPPAGATSGSLLFDVEGRLSGVWSAGNSGVAAPQVAALLATARRNVATGQLSAVADVSRRENHLYGSVAVATDLSPATVRVSPLETWQWESLQASGAAPLTFIGPMGRYRLEVSGPGGARREQDVTIRPAAHERLVVALRNVAAATPSGPAPVARKRSKLPWILGGVAAVGGAAAVAMGGGGGGGGTPTPPPPTTGTISVSVPVNPPLRSLSFPLRSR